MCGSPIRRASISATKVRDCAACSISIVSGSQIFHAALAVLEATVYPQQLAGVDHVSVLPTQTIWNPVKQRTVLQGDCQLVLRTGQRMRLMAACVAPWATDGCALPEHRPARGSTVCGAASGGSKVTDPTDSAPYKANKPTASVTSSFASEASRTTLAFFRQQVIEIPLHVALAYAVRQRFRRQKEVWAEREALRLAQPVCCVLKTPEVSHFLHVRLPER